MTFAHLDEAFLYFTECQIATLEQLRGRKSTAKCDLKRQESICRDMLLQIRGSIAKDRLESISNGYKTNAPTVFEILRGEREL